jgi:hypothetical protein
VATGTQTPPDVAVMDAIRRHLPGLADVGERLNAKVWELNDPVLLELCRLRMATLLGATESLRQRSAAASQAGLTEERIAQLASWPTSPLFSERERACLAFAEMFLFDPGSVDDELVGAVVEHLPGDGCYALTNALWVIEGRLRASLTLGRFVGRPADSPAPSAVAELPANSDPAAASSRTGHP